MASGPKRSRVRRVAGVIASVVFITFTFLAATLTAAVVHLDARATKRLMATQVSGSLDGMFAGKVQIEHISGLGLREIEGARVRVFDPAGVQVVLAEGIGVRIGAFEAARTALSGKGPIAVRLPSLSISNADINLDSDLAGNLRIANAFTPRKPQEPKSPDEPPGRGFRIEAPQIRLDHAWVHGTPPGAPFIDTDLWAFEARAQVDPSVVRAELGRVRFVARSLPRHVDPRGTLGGKFAMPAQNGQGIDVQAIFDGEIGGIPTTAEARLNHRRIDARIDAYDPTGAHASAVMSEIAIHEPLSLHAEAHGDLPRVEGQAELVLGKARASASAVVVASANTQVHGTFSARNVDVAAVSEGAPQTSIGLDARVDLAIQDGSVVGEASMATLPGTVDGREIPRVDAHGTFAGKTAQVRAWIHERTMPTEVALDLAPRLDAPEAQLLTAVVRSKIPELHRLPRVGTRVSGSADVEASGQILLPEKNVESAQAKVLLKNVNVTSERLSLGTLEVKATGRGRMDRPVVDAEIHGKQLRAGAVPIASIDARARIDVVDEVLAIHQVNVRATRITRETISASARLVRIRGSSLRIEGANLRGLGEPIRAEFSKDAREIRTRIDAPRIDLPLVVRIAGLEGQFPAVRGRVGIRGEGHLRDGVAKASLQAKVDDFALRPVKGVDAVVEASIQERDVGLAIAAGIGDAGRLDLHTIRLVIDGRADDSSSWRRAAGRVHVDGEVDVGRVATLLPADLLPVADVRGVLTIQGRVGRDTPEAPPEIALHAHTTGLFLAGPSTSREAADGIEVTGPPRWRSTDVDLGLDVKSDGSTGLTTIASRVTDGQGVVVAVDAKALLPYAELARDPVSARARLFESPLNVKVIIPPRRFDELPAVLAVKGLEGALDAELDASGSVLDPKVHAVARTSGLRSLSMQPATAADADLELDYDGREADLRGTVRVRERATLEIGGRVEARARDLVAGFAKDEKEPLAWNASGHVRLASFPLETVPQLSERRIRGRMSGEITLTDLHKDARVKGRVDFDGLNIGVASYEGAFMTASASAGRLAATIRLEQKDGFLDLSASHAADWGAQLIPTLDPHVPFEIKIEAKAFRAAAIQPFVESALPVLDGRIDANASARVTPGTPGVALEGAMSLYDGRVHFAALGEELREMRASCSFDPDGTIRVTDVMARGTQGEVYANASVKLDGLRVAKATANVGIPDRRALALVLEGQPIGEFSGIMKITATQSADAKYTSVTVDVPQLNVELPQVTKTGVQRLEEQENIRVGVYRDSRRFVALPLEKQDLKPAGDDTPSGPMRFNVDVRFGKVTVERGNRLRVNLTGQSSVTSTAGEPTIFGQIRVDSGWVDVQGKKFEIEKGTVTFNGELPPNPIVVATAAWVAADDTRVYADFVGPLKTGKLTLHSEPPRPKNEILALIVFGTADGANPQPPTPGKGPDGTTKAAVGLGGGFLAQGLTEALDDLAGIQATARIDTTRANNPRPEIEFQLSPRVSLGFAHVIGTPPITEPDRNLANIEYRFHRNWSLQTTFGDRGTALLDAIWQKRY